MKSKKSLVFQTTFNLNQSNIKKTVLWRNYNPKEQYPFALNAL